MDFVYLRVFLENYSLPTLVISVAVMVLNLIYDRFFADKFPLIVKNFLPFTLAIVFYYTYDMIFVLNAFTFTKGTFSAGILSGSLSIIMSSSIYKLKNGSGLTTDVIYLLIESLISDYVNKDTLCTTTNLIKNLIESDGESKEERITSTLKDNSSIATETELKALSCLIIKAVTSLKQK